MQFTLNNRKIFNSQLCTDGLEAPYESSYFKTHGDMKINAVIWTNFNRIK